MGVTSGDTVMTVDQAEAYSVPLISLISASSPRPASRSTASRSPPPRPTSRPWPTRRWPRGAKVVVLGTQVASNAQLFFQQLKSRGYTGEFSARTAPSTRRSSRCRAHTSRRSGSTSTTSPIAKPYIAAFKKQYGQTTSFGAPTWVAAQTIAMAISQSCTDGKTSRARFGPTSARSRSRIRFSGTRSRSTRTATCRRRRRHDLPDRERRYYNLVPSG